MVKTGNVCIGVQEVETQYTRTGRDSLLGNFASIFWPILARRGVRLPGGVLHWAKCTETITIYVRDLYLCASRDAGGPRMSLDECSRLVYDDGKVDPVPLRSKPLSQGPCSREDASD